MSEIAGKLAANLVRVRQRIFAAAIKAGRAAEEIKLVAVTKYVSSPVVRLLAAVGCTELGESRPQELWRKAAELADLSVNWHLVGHLQRNKVRRTLPLVCLIHSVDSRRLLKSIDQEATPASVRVLLEVNVSGESSKFGFTPQEIELLLEELPQYKHISVCGLMCMAGLEGGPEAARRQFATLRELRDRLRTLAPPEVKLDELSMGMSGDFEEAIAEGATIIRLGSILFEGLPSEA